MRTDDKRIYITLFLLYIAAVASLCFMRPESLPSVEDNFWGIPIDKVLHFIMFFPYPVLSGLSFMYRRFSLGRNFLILLVLTIAGAGLAYGTEVIQRETGYRSYDMGDYIADMVGMAAGAILTLIFIIIQKTRK